MINFTDLYVARAVKKIDFSFLERTTADRMIYPSLILLNFLNLKKKL